MTERMSMQARDDFGDRMKLYERTEASRRFMPLLPVVARLDGKCFSNLTRSLNRPFDEDFIMFMQMTTKGLVEDSNACIGYTQSDEITLVFYSDDSKSQIYFDGKIQKMVSVLASMCTAKFNSIKQGFRPIESEGLFDCRVWQLPNKVEAVNAVLWRESDATKNSISMAAPSVYSHKELHLKNATQMQDMLHAKGINWNEYPDHFKRGTYYQSRTRQKRFSAEEIDRLPEKHAARENPELEIERSEVARIDMPIFSKVVNRTEVVFDGAEPITGENL